MPTAVTESEIRIECMIDALYPTFDKEFERHFKTIEVEQLIDPDQFWELYDKLIIYDSGFKHNRRWLLEWFMEGMLYTAHIPETNEIFDSNFPGLFAYKYHTSPSIMSLPCFCAVKEGRCEALWVAEELRLRGIGRLFVKSLNITTIDRAVPGSEGFWKKML